MHNSLEGLQNHALWKETIQSILLLKAVKRCCSLLRPVEFWVSPNTEISLLPKIDYLLGERDEILILTHNFPSCNFCLSLCTLSLFTSEKNWALFSSRLFHFIVVDRSKISSEPFLKCEQTQFPWPFLVHHHLFILSRQPLKCTCPSIIHNICIIFCPKYTFNSRMWKVLLTSTLWTSMMVFHDWH